MTKQESETRVLIEGEVRRFFVEDLGFRARGRKFYKNLDGLQLAAVLSRGIYGPNNDLMYQATLITETSLMDSSAIHEADIEGMLGVVTDRCKDVTKLLNARTPLQNKERIEGIREFLHADATKWFEGVGDVELLSARIKRSYDIRNEGYITLRSGAEKVGIDV